LDLAFAILVCVCLYVLIFKLIFFFSILTDIKNNLKK